jgi:hypothetical protein
MCTLVTNTFLMFLTHTEQELIAREQDMFLQYDVPTTNFLIFLMHKEQELIPYGRGLRILNMLGLRIFYRRVCMVFASHVWHESMGVHGGQSFSLGDPWSDR